MVLRGTQSALRRWTTPGPPVCTTTELPWSAELLLRWQEVRSEFVHAFAAGSQEIPTISAATGVDQGNCGSWRVFVLAQEGRWIPENCHRFPVTTELTKRIPRLTSVGFSVLEPGAHIPAHTGPLDRARRLHLGLVVPRRSDGCGFRVGDRTLRWTEGEAFAFDDSVEHEAWNHGDTPRSVLVVEVRESLPRRWDLVNRVGRRRLAAIPDGVDPAQVLRRQGVPGRHAGGRRRRSQGSLGPGRRTGREAT